ncbi:antibiotic biosynthesis monooxygenase family protein [Paenibacillus sp. 1001270B_150601_E10]|uniref:antibiotic biosynthesis monooxygenase family protein n=1 Tax=Paenibacillus sp. 1001270B_150601_E10 TaxID=2787079 RepID=UPI00189D323C|nr:antibiotic biosynthesis monooxygenase [Paenibacillus sp. 1001270B_150601_E10]
MISEVANLHIQDGMASEFESQFRRASPLLIGSKGYISHELHKCIEERNKYLLIIKWQSVSDHLVSFKQSEAYAEWRLMLAPFFDSAVEAEHYIPIKLHTMAVPPV